MHLMSFGIRRCYKLSRVAAVLERSFWCSPESAAQGAHFVRSGAPGWRACAKALPSMRECTMAIFVSFPQHQKYTSYGDFTRSGSRQQVSAFYSMNFCDVTRDRRSPLPHKLGFIRVKEQDERKMICQPLLTLQLWRQCSVTFILLILSLPLAWCLSQTTSRWRALCGGPGPPLFGVFFLGGGAFAAVLRRQYLVSTY